MKRTLSTIVIVLIVGVLISTTGCTKGGTQEAKQAYKEEKIVYWRVWDNASDLEPLFSAYRAKHPNVSIEYRKLRYEEYEKELLEAMAEDRGPDVFSIHNTWLKEYEAKILPLPSYTTLPVKYLKGSIKKEEVVELQQNKSLTPLQVENSFLDVVSNDVIMPYNIGTEDEPKYVNAVWGLPLSVDTLVMYYNKDLLNNAGVIEPATNWQEFQEQVKKITKIDEATNNVLVAGAAIGTADNVTRSFDILSLLMMQNLTPMLNDDGYAIFNSIPRELSGIEVAPGLGALEFYTQFASPLYEGYTWNNQMPNNLDAFTKGKVGYFFGYAYHRPEIEAKAPRLNYAIAPVPQVGEGQKVNYANYWVETVSKKTKVKDYAWDFVQFISDEENVAKYLNQTKKPTALKSKTLINEQLADKDLMVFADQLLTAKSWYRGYNANSAETIFAELINTVLEAKLPSNKALAQAVEKINQIISKK